MNSVRNNISRFISSPFGYPFQAIFIFFGYFLLLKMVFLGLMMATRNALWVIVLQISQDLLLYATILILTYAILNWLKHEKLKAWVLRAISVATIVLILLMSADMMVQSIFGQRLVVTSALVMTSDANATASYKPSFVIYSIVMSMSFVLTFLSMVNLLAKKFSIGLIALFMAATLTASMVMDTKKESTAVWAQTMSKTMLAYNINFDYAKKEEDGQKKAENFEMSFCDAKPNENYKPDVIVILAESFSAIDSKRTNGVEGQLAEFDERSKDGLLFTNMISEGGSTDRAYVTLINGIAPYQYSLDDKRFEPYRAYRDTLATALSKSGYHTVFCKPYSLDFLGLRPWLFGSGFDEAYGREEFFGKNDKYVWDSQPDDVLYGHILDRTKTNANKGDEPLFIMATTISTHPPYISPGGHGIKACYKYSDKAFGEFYDALKKQGFFKHGILIVTGDHRKITPVSEAENKRYGDSTYARVAAFVAGYGITPGIENRPLGIGDIHYTLKQLAGSGVLKKDYNDFMTKEFHRDYALHELFTQRTKMVVVKEKGHYTFDFSDGKYNTLETISVANQRAFCQIKHK